MRLKYLPVTVLSIFLCLTAYAAQTQQVDVYVTSWCPYCTQSQEFLRSKNVDFKSHDIEKDPSANAEFKKLGGGGVPLIKIGDKLIRGFDRDEIVAALQ